MMQSPQNHQEDTLWDEFLQTRASGDLSQLAEWNAGKSVLVTGAGGWLGSALVKQIAAARPARLVLLDSAERNLYEIDSCLTAQRRSDGTPHVSILGDINDGALMASIFQRFKPEVVYHAAAFKQVPLLESNPFAAIRNNVLGTFVLAKTAVQYKASQFVMVSSDKAVKPCSMMGISKRIAELVLLALSHDGTVMKAVRLGNVLGSQGSVVPLFMRQIAERGPITVTHPEVRRYFITLQRSLEILLTAASSDATRGIYVPEMGHQIKVADLARHLIRRFAPDSRNRISIIFTGLRPGEKLKEDLIADDESIDSSIGNGLYCLDIPSVCQRELEHEIEIIAQSVRHFDEDLLRSTLLNLVPGYVPGRSPSAAQHEPKLSA